MEKDESLSVNIFDKLKTYIIQIKLEGPVFNIQHGFDHSDIVYLGTDRVHAIGGWCNQDLVLARHTGNANEQVNDLVGAHAQKQVANRGQVS